MARYEHLPIYLKAAELNLFLQNAVRHFSRYNKYSIGTELRDLARSILRQIIRANSSRDRGEALRDLVEHCEMLKTLLTLAREAGAFEKFSTFQHAASLAVILCKQSEGWLKSSIKGPNHQPAERTDR